MDQQKQLVLDGFRAVNEGDIESIVAMTGADAEYELVGGFADFAGEPVLRGPEAIRSFYTDWFETFTTTHVEPREFRAAGDRLLVLADVEVTTKESDTPVKLCIGQIYTFEDGAISRVASYYDREAAIKAARQA